MTDQYTPASNTEDGGIEHSVTDLFATVHERIGSAGVHMNESHAHLSALRTLCQESPPGEQEITTAELTALVQALEHAQDELEDAIELAVVAAEMVGASDTPGDQTRPDHSERDRADIHVPDLLWNTRTTHVVPEHIHFDNCTQSYHESWDNQINEL